ncbi:MAG: glycosyltransferase, partial [Candidatus Hydrogenedentales bacterium]
MATIFMAAYTNYRRDPRVKREAEALVAEGHRVVFLARRQPGEPSRETVAGVDVVKTWGLRGKPDSFAQYMMDYGLFFLALCAHLTLHPRRYALIHINNMPDFLVFAAWLPRLLGTPIIHDIHDLMPDLYMEKFEAGERHWAIRMLLLQERWAGRMATAVLTVEERLKDILAERGISREKIHVLINLPDDRIFKLRPTQAPKVEGAPFVLVYHGTQARRLGLDVAIRAVAALREEIPGVLFRIIGAGEERARLIALRDELGLQEHVTFSEGFVPVEEI